MSEEVVERDEVEELADDADEREEPVAAPAPVSSDVHSVAARAPTRNRLAADVEAFLARGGNIEQVPSDHRADPPRAQDNLYGRGSL